MPPLDVSDDLPSRRQFLQLMGASLGLAGLAGCIRMPEEKLAPYAHRPPSRTPGEPVSYATAMEIGGIAQGLLVTSYDGRPIKIEGNPSHPLNRGAADAIAQASILELYDPDRSRAVLRRDRNDKDRMPLPTGWDDFARWAKGVFQGDGRGICVLSEVSNSPSLADMRARLKQVFPKAEWFRYSPVADAPCLSEGVFPEGKGEVLKSCVPDLSKAKVILAINIDLFGGGNPMAVKLARDFAAGRRLYEAHGGPMNRLYVVESVPTVTGACADHRRALRPGAVTDFLAQLWQAVGLGEPRPPKGDSGVDRAFIDQLAADLKANRGRSAIIIGRTPDSEAGRFVDVFNRELGNIGRTIVPADAVAEPTTFAEMRQLDKRLLDGRVETLLILGGNPVYNAPRDLAFAESLAKVKNTIHLGLHDDETSRLCDWHLSRAHYLESWGDVQTFDGTVSIVQPLIEPMFDGRSAIEVLAMLSGDKEGIDGGGYEIVRRTFRSLKGMSFSEWKWKKALADGIVEGAVWQPPKVKDEDDGKGKENSQGGMGGGTFRVTDDLDVALPPAGENQYELVFFPDAKVHDGRFANNGWLQEMPDPMTRLTWGNAALMNEKTAAKIGVKADEMVALLVDGPPKVEFPVLLQPGMPDGVIGVALGYGRTAAGSIGSGVGQNAYLLRDSAAIERGWTPVRARPTGKTYSLATVQDHHVIDKVGREAIQERIPELIHECTLAELQKDPTLGHKPGNSVSIFNPHRLDGRSAAALDPKDVPAHDLHRWGLAVDLSACVGCASCVIACQAENNIPIVGKEQVLLGREMHWIRVDRYFREGEGSGFRVQGRAGTSPRARRTFIIRPPAPSTSPCSACTARTRPARRSVRSEPLRTAPRAST